MHSAHVQVCPAHDLCNIMFNNLVLKHKRCKVQPGGPTGTGLILGSGEAITMYCVLAASVPGFVRDLKDAGSARFCAKMRWSGLGLGFLESFQLY